MIYAHDFCNYPMHSYHLCITASTHNRVYFEVGTSVILRMYVCMYVCPELSV